MALHEALLNGLAQHPQMPGSVPALPPMQQGFLNVAEKLHLPQGEGFLPPFSTVPAHLQTMLCSPPQPALPPRGLSYADAIRGSQERFYNPLYRPEADSLADRPSLDDVERLSRGEATKGKIGSRAVPHRLNTDERKAYELAKKRGYLVRQFRSREYPLSNTYRNYCDAVGWPNLRIDQGPAGSLDTMVVDLTTLRLEEGNLTALEEEMRQCITEEFGSVSDQHNEEVEAPLGKLHEAMAGATSSVEFGEPKSGVSNFQFLRSDARRLCQIVQDCCKMYIPPSTRKLGS